jgi:diguanylate cyclase (GGDEF)-like protein
MEYKQGNLAVTNIMTASNRERKFDVKRLKVTNALQTTLAADRLIKLFSEQIEPFINQTGLEYHNETINLEVQTGKPASHSCSYNLIIEDEELGHLKLMRRKRFSTEEIEQIEALLCCLIYPLRNAIMYKKALLSASTDVLTGLNNRSSFNKDLQHSFELSKRYNTPFSLLMIDIDFFKKINDTHGHAAGDLALVAVAKSIKESIRDSDIAFRYGGEEFVIILNNTGEPGTSLLAERIRQNIADLVISTDDAELKLTASIGSAILSDSEECEELLKRADTALYQAKNSGRNQVVAAG